MSLIKREIGELLVDNGLLSTEQLQVVQAEKEKTGQSISQILTNLGIVTENQLKDTLELQYGVTYVALNKIKIEPRTINLLPAQMIREHWLLPISQDDDRLNVAMVNPDDTEALTFMKVQFPHFQIKPMVCLEDDFERFVNFFFPIAQPAKLATVTAPPPQEEPVAAQPELPESLAKPPVNDPDLPGKEADASDLGQFLLQKGVLDIDQLFESLSNSLKTNTSLAETLINEKLVSRETLGQLVRLMNSSSPSFGYGHETAETLAAHSFTSESQTGGQNGGSNVESDDDIDFLNLFKHAPQTPVSLLAHQIITKAVEKKWGDIHIEGRSDYVLIKYWSQGEVVEEARLDRGLLTELVASYKLFAGLNPTLITKPQDNRIPMTVLNWPIELRVTTIPDDHQEMVALSITYLQA